LVSRKNDIRFDVEINPWQAPWGLPRVDTVYFTDPVRNYLIYYQISDSYIDILAIWDSRRDPKKFKL
jgi:hypothetical protein